MEVRVLKVFVEWKWKLERKGEEEERVLLEKNVLAQRLLKRPGCGFIRMTDK